MSLAGANQALAIFLQATRSAAFLTQAGIGLAGSVSARKCSYALGGKSSSATIFYNRHRAEIVW
jgi:hypothetical protein